MNEVVRYAAMGMGVISRELARFTAAGLLVISKQGNQNHYQANADCSIFNELKQIALKTFGVAGLLRAGLEPFFAQLEQAFLYGSTAKGEAHAASDIDLMLVGNDLSYSDIMQVLEPIERQLGRAVNPTLYSIAEFTERLADRQNFLTKMMAQGHIDLLDGSQEAE